MCLGRVTYIVRMDERKVVKGAQESKLLCNRRPNRK